MVIVVIKVVWSVYQVLLVKDYILIEGLMKNVVVDMVFIVNIFITVDLNNKVKQKLDHIKDLVILINI